jgi:hypothetical protein
MRDASYVTHHATEEEFEQDKREHQEQQAVKGGSSTAGSANDAVKDTKHALLQRGEQLQVCVFCCVMSLEPHNKFV